MGAEYFNMYIPPTFRRIIVKAAYSYFADINRENECSYEINELENGCSVRIRISDTAFTLMDMTLYAPDSIQAEFIGERVKRNPTEFYSQVMKLALNNPEENFDNIEI